jgi:undecaprenyl-diphosphatase
MSLRADDAPSRWVLAVAALLVAANLTVFFLIAEDVIDGGGLISHDTAVLNWFVEHRSDALIWAARLVSTLATFTSLSIIGVVLAVILWRRPAPKALTVAPLLSLVLAGISSNVAKAHYGRARPPETLHAAHVATAAFPSAHAADAAAFFLAAAFTLALIIARRRSARLALVAGAVGLAGLVGISRLVLAVHWLSDVVAGWTLGAAIAITVVVTAWRLTCAVTRSTRARVPPQARPVR